MPSYRTVMTVTSVRPGRCPEEVERCARAVVRLESWDIGIVAGQPRVTARFAATDEAQARAIHERVARTVAEIAEVPRSRLAAVVAGRSHYLTPWVRHACRE